MKEHIYYTYILTNRNKTVLYTGVTNDLKRRLYEHNNTVFNQFTFTKKYQCFYLIFFEEHNNIDRAIEREKEIKGWKRNKKVALISQFNPEWKFFNDLIMSN